MILGPHSFGTFSARCPAWKQRASKIDQFERHPTAAKFLHERIELQSLAQLCEVASLYRRVPEYHRGRSRERHVFENRFDNTRMGEEAFQTIATLIEMHDEIRLQDNARAGWNKRAERIPVGRSVIGRIELEKTQHFPNGGSGNRCCESARQLRRWLRTLEIPIPRRRADYGYQLIHTYLIINVRQNTTASIESLCRSGDLAGCTIALIHLGSSV